MTALVYPASIANDSAAPIQPAARNALSLAPNQNSEGNSQNPDARDPACAATSAR